MEVGGVDPHTVANCLELMLVAIGVDDVRLGDEFLNGLLYLLLRPPLSHHLLLHSKVVASDDGGNGVAALSDNEGESRVGSFSGGVVRTDEASESLGSRGGLAKNQTQFAEFECQVGLPTHIYSYGVLIPA